MKIKNCPCCESSNLKYMASTDWIHYWIQCGDCGVNGPILDKLEDFLDPVKFHRARAVYLWNKFAEDQQTIDKTLSSPQYVNFHAQVVETR